MSTEVRSNSPIVRDREVMSGTPVFAGTRITVGTLFDYLEHGDSIEDFLKVYPDVGREQAERSVHMARQMLLPDDSD